MSTSIDAITPSYRALSLQGADWLADEKLQLLIRTIAGDDQDVRVVGGAVRNWLMGRPIADIDLATTALPKVVMARTRRSDMRPIPTGLEHGTVTVVVGGTPFEVTTLREDIATDGRRATVRFGRDWSADARRRDFTVNALYATAAGEIIDLVGGAADCAARRIRFIGDPYARIREDYLRILRLFRFHASLSDGPIDPPGLEAAVTLRDGLMQLSGERIGQEMLKLVVADHAPSVLRVMQDAGILPLAIGMEAVDIDRFTQLHALIVQLRQTERTHTQDPAPLLLAGLAAEGPLAFATIVAKLRLSNATSKRIRDAGIWSHSISPTMSNHDARAVIVRSNQDIFCDALLLRAAGAEGQWQPGRIEALVDLAATFSPPKFPIGGRDLTAIGYSPGEKLGAALARLKQAWIDSEFSKTKAELLADARIDI